MFKISKILSVSLMSELFYQKVNHYDLRNPYEFSILNVNSVFHGQASIRYLVRLIWQLVPSEFKDENTVSVFKAAEEDSLIEGKSEFKKVFWIYLS